MAVARLVPIGEAPAFALQVSGRVDVRVDDDGLALDAPGLGLDGFRAGPARPGLPRILSGGGDRRCDDADCDDRRNVRVLHVITRKKCRAQHTGSRHGEQSCDAVRSSRVLGCARYQKARL